MKLNVVSELKKGLKGFGGIFVVAIVLFIGIYALLGFLFTYSDSVTGSAAVSNFSLAPDSRLPRWFNVSNEYKREDLNVKIAYYANCDNKPNFKADLILKGKKIETKYGTHENLSDPRKNPSFIEGKIDGINEIIEHKEAGPIFYISDEKK